MYKVSEATKATQRELARTGTSDGLHLVYRCYDCGRLITKLEILEGRDAMRAETCPCGSRTIKPTNAKRWEEFLPRFLKLVFAFYTKRVAPPPVALSPERQAEVDRIGKKKTREFERLSAEMVRKGMNRPGLEPRQ